MTNDPKPFNTNQNSDPSHSSWDEAKKTNSEIIEWALITLQAPLAKIKTIVQTPWSNVFQIHTAHEFFYLKQTPDLLALESAITQILHDQFHAAVPKVIAHHAELNCFLMKDAGRPLREILKQRFDANLVCKAIDQFTSLQLTVTDHVDVFLDIGVPDWRLNKLPDLFEEIILQKELLIADGLSETERRELETLLPTVSNLCKKLSGYSIKETIVQPDFNDNNTLINDVSQDITIIDLGEISISHPFFSMLNCLQQIRKHHALTEDDDRYLRIKDECIKNHMKFFSKKSLLEAFAISQMLWPVYWILAQYRLMIACGKEKMLSLRPGRLSGSLKELLAACQPIGKPLQGN